MKNIHGYVIIYNVGANVGMKNHNRKSSLSSGILLLTVGGIFTAIGIALFAITIKGIVTAGDLSVIGWGIIMPIVLILALLGFGTTAFIMGGKKVCSRIKQSVTYRRGKDGTARVIDHKSASFDKGGNKRIRYSLILAYNDGNEDKTFTTDYLFDVNEYKYLQKLDGIKVKINGNFVTVCEPFPKDIYKVDSIYGIEMAFFKQKPVAILLSLWLIFFIAAAIFLTVSFFIGNSAITSAAIIAVFAVHFPFVIPLAVLMIIWINRIK